MKPNPRTRISNYEQLLTRPKPPTKEMVARAQPFRADTLQEFEASIRDTRNPVVIDV